MFRDAGLLITNKLQMRRNGETGAWGKSEEA
jgi:hypothetical protein